MDTDIALGIHKILILWCSKVVIYSPRLAQHQSMVSTELPLGIVTGLRNPRVSARVGLGYGYGLDLSNPRHTRTRSEGWRVSLQIQTPLENDQPPSVVTF